MEECKTLGGCATGAAKITYGYNLPASYIIHTVGPIYNGKVEQRLELADCYKNSLDLARKHHLHSIAFPAISTGAYAYPVDEAARIALLTCTEWINANADYGMSVVLTCFKQRRLQRLSGACKKGADRRAGLIYSAYMYDKPVTPFGVHGFSWLYCTFNSVQIYALMILLNKDLLASIGCLPPTTQIRPSLSISSTTLANACRSLLLH
mgnify:CR=1 FL=1